MRNIEELETQIKRFQSFKERTGTDKSSSYSVEIYFSAWNDEVTVKFGGYNVGSWSRSESIKTTWNNLIADVTAKVDEADEITKDYNPDYGDWV